MDQGILGIPKGISRCQRRDQILLYYGLLKTLQLQEVRDAQEVLEESEGGLLQLKTGSVLRILEIGDGQGIILNFL